MPLYIDLTLHGITERDPQDIFVPQDIEFSDGESTVLASFDETDSNTEGNPDGTLSVTSRLKGLDFTDPDGNPVTEDRQSFTGMVDYLRSRSMKVSNIAAFSDFVCDSITVEDLAFYNYDTSDYESLSDLIGGPVLDFGA